MSAVLDDTPTMSTRLTKPVKPLGSKAYGSIGHLPSSRVGPGDWHVHEGQARICCEKPRKGDRIIVTEKVDGACMAVAKIDGRIVALSRAGYLACDALYPHLLAFPPFVEERRATFDALLADGERICGEWMALAHGTRYDARHLGFAPFLAFDIFRGGARVLRDEFVSRTDAAGISRTHLLHDGADAMSVDYALLALGPNGHHGAIDAIEGAVWRVEREGRVDFLAKYVVSDKVDGRYLSNISGQPEIWNFVCAERPISEAMFGADVQTDGIVISGGRVVSAVVDLDRAEAVRIVDHVASLPSTEAKRFAFIRYRNASPDLREELVEAFAERLARPVEIDRPLRGADR